MSSPPVPLQLRYVPASHLDLFWLGTHFSCLQRGAELTKDYLDACLADAQQTYLIETPVFAEYFLACYPEYREPLLRLVREGRVEVGACYVDRFETLCPEESL